MAAPIADTELILTSEGRLYHINLKSEEIAGDVILVGDPGRVAEVSSRFASIEHKSNHREFIAHTGFYNGKRVTVLSTGIGTDNIDIVMNELDAAVNIDPATRLPRHQHTPLNIYRLGTCGAVQSDLGIDSLVVSSHGLGLDCLLNYYEKTKDVADMQLSEAFVQHVSWPQSLHYPYCVAGSQGLLSLFDEFPQGITATAPGFYAPQNRRLRLSPALPALSEDFSSFRFNGLRILNFEMETSALYGLSRMLGHNSVTICVVIANRIKKEFSRDYKQSVGFLIDTCLNKITQK